MSFFGFDTSGRRSKERNGDSHGKESPLDFEETYKGLGEYEAEEEDFLNDETFGAGAELGTDFDFGHGNGDSGAGRAPASSSHASGGRSYVAVARSGVEHSAGQPLDAAVDLRPMESLWNSGVTPGQEQTLSMEELERQQRQRQMGGQPGFMAMPPAGYGMPPQGFPQQPQAQAGPGPNVPFGNQFSSPYPPQGMQPGVQGLPPQFQNMPAMFNQAYNVPQGHHPNHQFPGMFPPPPSSQVEPAGESGDSQRLQPVEQNARAAQIASPGRQQMEPVQPVLSPPQQRFQTLQAQPPQQQQQQLPSSPQPMISPPQTPREHGRSNRGQTRREPMTPEEQKRLQIRQAKVEKILKHSGLMTPRDKDFITRYQLSQIVTEDPYNEDFYFQVYKIIQRGGVVGESNKDLIARAYLEHSGHRLGGRYKRADVALQRMQSQVEKAVTVAKERPQKNKDHSDAAREGVLGRISSSMNSKAPRRQLQIPVHKTGDDSAIADDSKSSRGGNQALNVVTESLDQVEISQQSRARRRSSYAFTSVDQNSVLSRSGGRKFVLSLIETVYEEVLELEAQLRSGNAVDSTTLWEALHIGDSSYEVCPFISMLSFDKGIKIMPRIFNFLDNAQKLKLLQTFFGELSHLNIIIISSYKTNASPTESQLKQIELFQAVFLKIIVSFLSSSANFIEIMGLLLYLIKNNNVSFISTSKIGLNLITVLISRAALIRQDINRTNVLSSPEISAWNEVYDKLFTSLETKLFLVFPPKEYMEKIIQATSRSAGAASQAVPKVLTASYDQAYIWQFLASLALSGKLNHQRIIIDEIRDEIFGTISVAEELGKSQQDATASQYKKDKLYQDLNLFLNVMGLVARDGEITELK